MKTVIMLVVFLNSGDMTGAIATNMVECKRAAAEFNVANIKAELPVMALCSEVDGNAEDINTVRALDALAGIK